MIAVMVLAALFALPSTWSVSLVAILIAIACPGLALIGAQWQLSRGYRRLAALCFGIVGIMANIAYVACCICPISFVLTALVIGLVFVVPTILSFGVAWATMATGESSLPQRSARAAWPSVIGLSVMPLMTVCTVWPFHLFFLTAKPTMELLADQAAAGTALRGPQWVGPFRLLASQFDPATGDVRLLIEPNPSHPSGFVRFGPRTPPKRESDEALNLDLHLGGRWWYFEED